MNKKGGASCITTHLPPSFLNLFIVERGLESFPDGNTESGVSSVVDKFTASFD